jgi:VIT1/CCC1 family predicted Fe2+/Mn2+ transporter
MGLGGYLAARTDADHYDSERQRERQEIEQHPCREEDEVVGILGCYGLSDEHIVSLAATLRAHPERWVDFMMRFELGLEMPDPKRARVSALTIAGSYIVGGLIPLLPYIFLNNIFTALWGSIAVTLVALFIFGYVKSRFTGIAPLRGGLQTVLVGGLAAAAAFGIARLIG